MLIKQMEEQILLIQAQYFNSKNEFEETNNLQLENLEEKINMVELKVGFLEKKNKELLVNNESIE